MGVMGKTRPTQRCSPRRSFPKVRHLLTSTIFSAPAIPDFSESSSPRREMFLCRRCSSTRGARGSHFSGFEAGTNCPRVCYSKIPYFILRPSHRRQVVFRFSPCLVAERRNDVGSYAAAVACMPRFPNAQRFAERSWPPGKSASPPPAPTIGRP